MKVIYTKDSTAQLNALGLKFSLLLAFITASFSNTIAQCDANYVQIGSYHVEFVGVQYDYPASGQSTWYYTITATSGKDISHVTFPMNKNCIEVLDMGTWGNDMSDLHSGQGKPSFGKDPKAKIWGVKFDQGIDKGDHENYYFTLGANLAVEPIHEMAIKAGRPFYKGTVCGPSSECLEPVDEPIVSCISGQTFYDANVNGIRDMDELPIEGVTVNLMTSNGLQGQIITGADGTYSFCGVDVDVYIIQMVNDPSYYLTNHNVGSDEFDSDLMGNDAYSEPIFINEIGDVAEHVDGGYFKFGDYDQQAFEEKNPNDHLEKTTEADRRKRRSNPYPNTFRNTNIERVNAQADVFPNPVLHEVTFNLREMMDTEIVIELRSQSNQLIKKTVIPAFEQQQQMDMSDLPRGVYFAYFISTKGTEVKKIIKAN